MLGSRQCCTDCQVTSQAVQVRPWFGLTLMRVACTWLVVGECRHWRQTETGRASAAVDQLIRPMLLLSVALTWCTVKLRPQ